MVFLPVVLGVLSALLVTSAAALAFYYFYCSRKFPVGSKGGGDGTDVEKCPPTSKVSDHPDTPQGKGGSTTTVVTRHGWEEIRTMTSGFSSTVLGEGGFSTVYLARLPSDSSFSLAAVKVHRDSERLHRAFRQELDLLLHVRHENIVRLIGYSDEGEQGALVFEYAPSGTLHEKLHGDGEEGVLPWGRRMSIAYQLASALDYLHSSRDLQVVHNDVKPSNVLLDGDLDCKLCDFGSAKVGFSSTVAPPSSTSSPSPSRTDQRQPMLGSPGYVDPHYLRTGLVSKMSDIYSFGVVALELMTGREAFCPETGRMLAKEMGPALKEEKLGYLVDGRLGGEYDAREAAAVAEVVRRCVGEQPSLRPSMGEVVVIMREKVPSCIQAVGSKSKGAVDVGHEFGV